MTVIIKISLLLFQSPRDRRAPLPDHAVQKMASIQKMLPAPEVAKTTKPEQEEPSTLPPIRVKVMLFCRTWWPQGHAVGPHDLSTLVKVHILSIASGHMRMVSANERRRYICNVFSHWLRPFSCDQRWQTNSAYTANHQHLRIVIDYTVGWCNLVSYDQLQHNIAYKHTTRTVFKLIRDITYHHEWAVHSKRREYFGKKWMFYNRSHSGYSSHLILDNWMMCSYLCNYTNPGYGLSLVDTLWNAGSYRQPLEQEGNPMI